MDRKEGLGGVTIWRDTRAGDLDLSAGWVAGEPPLYGFQQSFRWQVLRDAMSGFHGEHNGWAPWHLRDLALEPRVVCDAQGQRSLVAKFRQQKLPSGKERIPWTSFSIVLIPER